MDAGIALAALARAELSRNPLVWVRRMARRRRTVHLLRGLGWSRSRARRAVRLLRRAARGLRRDGRRDAKAAAFAVDLALGA